MPSLVGSEMCIRDRTIEANIDALGDGSTVKTITTVPTVYPESVYTIEKPDIVPTKFKVALPTSVTSSVTAGTPAVLTLAADLPTGTFSKTVEQVTAQKIKTRTTTRALPSADNSTVSLSSTKLTSQGVVGTVAETYSASTTPQTFTPDYKTVEASVENLGDGTSVLTTVTVNSWPDMNGQILVNSPVGAVLASVTETIKASGDTTPTGGLTTLSESSEPINALTNKYKKVSVAGTATQGTPTAPDYPTLTSYDYDSQANIEVTTTRQVVAAGTAAPSLVPPALITGATASSQFGSPAVTMDDYKTQNYQSLILTQKDNPIDQWKTLRITSKIPYLPATRTEYKTGSFTIPSLLRGVNMSLWQMPSGRYDVKWTPNQRAAVGVPTPFRVVTSFHYGYPTDLVTSSNNALFQFKPSNLIYRGDSFTVNIPNVINDGFIMGACFDQTTFTPSTTGYTTAIVVGGVTSSTDTFFTFGSLGLIGDNGSGQGDPAGYIRYQLAALNNDSILGAVNEQVIFAPSSPSLSQYLSYTSPSSTFVNSTAAITAHQKISSKTSTYYTCTITIPSTSTIPAGSYVVVTGNSLANTTSPVFLSNGLAGSGTFSYTVGPTATTSITTGLTVTVYSGDPQSATKLTSYDVEYWRAGIYIMRRHYVTLF